MVVAKQNTLQAQAYTDVWQQSDANWHGGGVKVENLNREVSHGHVSPVGSRPVMVGSPSWPPLKSTRQSLELPSRSWHMWAASGHGEGLPVQLPSGH